MLKNKHGLVRKMKYIWKITILLTVMIGIQLTNAINFDESNEKIIRKNNYAQKIAELFRQAEGKTFLPPAHIIAYFLHGYKSGVHWKRLYPIKAQS